MPGRSKGEWRRRQRSPPRFFAFPDLSISCRPCWWPKGSSRTACKGHLKFRRGERRRLLYSLSLPGKLSFQHYFVTKRTPVVWLRSLERKVARGGGKTRPRGAGRFSWGGGGSKGQGRLRLLPACRPFWVPRCPTWGCQPRGTLAYPLPPPPGRSLT